MWEEKSPHQKTSSRTPLFIGLFLNIFVYVVTPILNVFIFLVNAWDIICAC